ncbi:HAD-IA family hydrolase [Humitalea sp. 24SJ18S-53]|uniref:HAD-IA family hydrolase n=1 Tax=Humitalea sp. 24SJ18S-53 TaxID=3422307 RepID=UPI003D67EDA6
MTPTILLDLDGTLVDSVPDLHAALDRMLLGQGLGPLSRAEATAMIGDGVKVLVERAFSARGRVATAADVAAYMDDYEANAAAATIPFVGIPEALAEMAAAGWRLAVCTNKPERAARSLLAELGLTAHFAAVGGGDSYPVKKPDPGHVLATLAAAGGAPGHAVMVGDHANDMLSGRAAGLPVVFCAWGYGRAAMAGDAPVAASPADLLGVVTSVLRGSGATLTR